MKTRKTYHYRWPGWLTRMHDANRTRSMSRKGCSANDAMVMGSLHRISDTPVLEQYVQILHVLPHEQCQSHIFELEMPQAKLQAAMCKKCTLVSIKVTSSTFLP